MTFSSHPLVRSPDISIAGRHVSAVEFHSVLQSAGNFLRIVAPLFSFDCILCCFFMVILCDCGICY